MASIPSPGVGSNGLAVEAHLGVERFLADLDSLAFQADHHIQQLEAEKAELTAQIERLKRVQRALNPVAVQTKSKTYTTTGKKTTASAHRMLETAELILENFPSRNFSALELHHDVLGGRWSEPHTYMIMNALRDMEFLAKVGKNPDTKREEYRVLDAHRIEQLRDKREESNA